MLDFRQALSIDENYIPALIEKGITQFQFNQQMEAVNTMTECIEKHSSDVCFHNRGVLHLRLENLNYAENDFKSALAINPSC